MSLCSTKAKHVLSITVELSLGLIHAHHGPNHAGPGSGYGVFELHALVQYLRVPRSWRESVSACLSTTGCTIEQTTTGGVLCNLKQISTGVQ